MKTARKTLAALIAGLCAAASAYAYTASELVDAATYAELRKNGQIQKSYYKQNSVTLGLVPTTPLAQAATTIWPADAEKPAFVVENLYLLPKAQLGSADKTNIDYASKVIRSVSKMEGMQYYSRSDKKWETLYKDAYCIKGPKDRTRIPDDTAGSADGKVMYCMQNDNSFGKTNYRLSYRQTADEVSAGFVNVTPLYVGPIKAVTADNLRISLVITDCGDDFLVYMLVQSKFPALSILEDTMNDSFGSRLEAIYTWFTKQF